MARKTTHEDVQDGGLKPADAKPEPLVGEDRKTDEPTQRLERVVRETTSDQRVEDQEVAVAAHASRDSDVVVTEGHGADAVANLALELAVEADGAAPKDERTSAEAVDQGSHVRPIDIERAELDAGTHAERLKDIEEEVGSDTIGVANRAAGDRQGDHVSNVSKAAHAAADAPSNVASGRAFSSLEDQGRVDSPHGRTAEAHDAWQGARWAPHGDLNVPAEAYGENGVLGVENPTTKDQVRGLLGDSDNAVERAKRAAGPGTSIARERYEENEAALRIASEEQSTLQSFGLSEK